MTRASSAPTRSPLSLRRSSPEDWKEVERLLSAAGLPLDGARDHLADFVLAESDGVVIGCAAVERYGDAGLLRSVAVAASERGSGVGVALVERCLEDARAAGLSTVVLLTTTAERYFPRFGFEIVDRSAVPDAVNASAELRGACPVSARVMRLRLDRISNVVATFAVRIRPAQREDAPAIAAIYNEGIRARTSTFETRERTPAEVEEWFAADGRYPILVAERDGRVIGWIAASAYRARDCYRGVAEFSVYVASDERKRRVGDALVHAFLPELERAGFWKVLSRIFPENDASLALCRRHGFREVGIYRRHARLDGVWRDVIIVDRLLGDALHA